MDTSKPPDTPEETLLQGMEAGRTGVFPRWYLAQIVAVAERIEALLPSHPEVLTAENAAALLKIDGFKVDDIAPTGIQVSVALDAVRAKYAERNR